jgi:hypothetical protein
MDTVPAALSYWRERLQPEDAVLVTGSCFLVAEVLHHLGFEDLEQTACLRLPAPPVLSRQLAEEGSVASNLVVGADVGGTSVKYTVVDAVGPSPFGRTISTDPGDAAGTIARLAAQVSAQAGGRGARVLVAVGLACAGIVAPQSGGWAARPTCPAGRTATCAGPAERLRSDA